jgi:hypothetical protein
LPSSSQFCADLRRQRALRALLQEPTVTAAAKAAKLSRRTLQNYLAEEEFQAELDALRARADEAELDSLRDFLRQRVASARRALARCWEEVDRSTTPPAVRAALLRELLRAEESAASLREQQYKAAHTSPTLQALALNGRKPKTRSEGLAEEIVE